MIVAVGDHVLVETERGREVGMVVKANFEVSKKQIDKLKSPLKPVVRVLTDLDYDHIDALEARSREAMPVFREAIKKFNLDIKPVEIQYLFSGDRATFFFTSENRVDFRDLVRELSTQLHVRIDMRQINARDEARVLGGLAHCGEELCCCRFGGDFQPVSIRMAKEQDLPLNPLKISGVCGRLMCCLRHELEAYRDFKKRAPKKGTLVETPLGTTTVTGFDTPRELIELRLADGKRLSVPLSEMNCQKDAHNCKRCSVSHETIAKCASPSLLLALEILDQQLETPAVQEPRATNNTVAVDVEPPSGRRLRQRARGGLGAYQSAREASAGGATEQGTGATTTGGVAHGEGHAPETGRLASASQATGTGQVASASQATSTNQATSANAQSGAEARGDSHADGARPRPGQYSSGLRQRQRNNTDRRDEKAAHGKRRSSGERRSSGANGERRSPVTSGGRAGNGRAGNLSGDAGSTSGAPTQRTRGRSAEPTHKNSKVNSKNGHRGDNKNGQASYAKAATTASRTHGTSEDRAVDIDVTGGRRRRRRATHTGTGQSSADVGQ
jgi:cell fate regulator YaaT (PSP1 superfamily)